MLSRDNPNPPKRQGIAMLADAVTAVSLVIIFAMFICALKLGRRPTNKSKTRAEDLLKISQGEGSLDLWDKFQKISVLKDFAIQNEEGAWEVRDGIADFDAETLWGDATSGERFWLEQGPSIFVAAGIFFTFVGIILGLWELKLDSDALAIQQQLGQLVGGLRTAFFSSIAGVFCSVIFTYQRTQWTSGAEQATQQLRRHLIQEGKLLTPESMLRRMMQSLEVTQEATLANQSAMMRLVDEAQDLKSTVGTLATDIAEKVSVQLGDRMDTIVDAKLSAPLTDVRDSFTSFASGQVASQSDALAAVVQTFVEKLQSELHVHFDELAAALRETRGWYEDTHAIFRETGETLGIQVALQRDMLEEERSFFAGMRGDLGTLASHREQLTAVETGLLQRLSDTLQHARTIEEEARATLNSLETTANHTEAMSRQQRDAYKSLLDQSDQLTRQLGTYATQVQGIGEGFRASLDQLRNDLGEGMTTTFSSFDEGAAQVVNHLNGSFTLLKQGSTQLDGTVAALNKSLGELRVVLHQLPQTVAQSVAQSLQAAPPQPGAQPGPGGWSFTR